MSMYLCETSRNIQEPWPIFHSPLTSVFGQIIKVKFFVQDRILSSTNGSKLIFHMRMYLYETSRSKQEPWPHDIFHGLLTQDFGQLSMSKPTAAVLCPWARHFTPRKYWLITQEAMAPSRHDWKIVTGTLSLNTTNQLIMHG